MTEPANADQRAYWNDAAGETWAELQAALDAQLQPIGAATLRALAPAAGARLLDVGCGCGQTTLELAAAVGPQGHVTGVDISRPMLDVAAARPAPQGAARIDYRLADAQTEAFGDAAFDGMFSRFGVMFFEDPPAAFANLRRALRPGGRIAFVCWRAMAENPMFTTPMAAALRHLPPPAPPEPGAPGPFAFAAPGRAAALLDGAGFTRVDVAPLDLTISPGAVEEALALTLRIGPLGAMLREHPDRSAAVVSDLRVALSEEAVDGRVVFPSATWLATAEAP